MLFTHADWPACLWLKDYLSVWREAKWLPISLWWRGKFWLKHSKVTSKFENWCDCISDCCPSAEGNRCKSVSYIMLPFTAFFQRNVHLTLHLCILIQQKDNPSRVYLTKYMCIYIIMQTWKKSLRLTCHQFWNIFPLCSNICAESFA